jgi:hypothetical protein
MSLVIELTNGSRAPSADVCRIRTGRRGEMKSTRRAARSRSAVYRLDALEALVTTSVIYLVPLTVGAAPFLFLYWLYQPTVLTNPGLSAHKAPLATLLLPPPRRLEAPEFADMPSRASLADVTEDFAQPELNDEKPKSQPNAGGPHPVVASGKSHLVTNMRTQTSRRSARTAINNPGRYAGMSTRDPADAYAYALDGSGRHRW